MTKVLSTEEQTLLQRYYDGDELPPGRVDDVQALLNRSPNARVFMAALEELTLSMQVVEELLWEDAAAPTVESLVEAASTAASLTDAPLEELAPLLERFWDGEVLPEEMAVVQALLTERDDVADYMATLEGIRTNLRATNEELVGGASFEGFWDSLEARIDADSASFEPDEHRVLLYRYHDGEASAAERAQVDGWLEAQDPAVTDTLGALAELQLATVAGVEVATERADLSGLWTSIEDAIDDGIESQGENVVSLARQKRERKGFLADYRQGVFAAVATVLIIAFAGGLFKASLFSGPERVVVEKTVVIVDSVEYQPGSSVMVNSPMKTVSGTTMETPEGAPDEGEEEPTVIWLLDTSEEDETAPAAGEEQNDETDEEALDTDEELNDQPI